MILAAAYTMISRTLWQSMDAEKELVRQTSGTWAVFYQFFICSQNEKPCLLEFHSFIYFLLFSPRFDLKKAEFSSTSSTRKRQKVNNNISFHKLRNSSQEFMLLNRDSKKHTFGLRR
jgi:hypothetical protein